MYLIPTLIVILVSYNVVDSNEPKGPFDPNKGVVEPVFTDTIPTQIKKETKKKPKNLSKPKELVISTQSTIPSQTIQTVVFKDSIN